MKWTGANDSCSCWLEYLCQYQFLLDGDDHNLGIGGDVDYDFGAWVLSRRWLYEYTTYTVSQRLLHCRRKLCPFRRPHHCLLEVVISFVRSSHVTGGSDFVVRQRLHLVGRCCQRQWLYCSFKMTVMSTRSLVACWRQGHCMMRQLCYLLVALFVMSVA